MFNAVIFMQSVRKNGKLWLVLTGVVSFFACMVAYLAKVNPGFALPGSRAGADILTVYAGAFYGMMGLMLVLVYAIAAGNRLVASEVDKGDMAYTLNTPVSRREVVVTKAVFHVSSVFLMILALSAAGTAANALLSPGKLDAGVFWAINAVMFCFMFSVSGISFAASCWFNKSGQSLAVGAGLPIAFFLFHTLAGFGGELEFFRYFTLNTLFDPMGIIGGRGYALEALSLLAVGLALYAAGIARFLRKDLPL
ncbi:MAG TPA: ABC transporter permease subunit [Candidatus Limnocylindria bacterium]|nr:ABC transporter permease subunit [Candidatus Limnocylindria bacterium]